MADNVVTYQFGRILLPQGGGTSLPPTSIGGNQPVKLVAETELASWFPVSSARSRVFVRPRELQKLLSAKEPVSVVRVIPLRRKGGEPLLDITVGVPVVIEGYAASEGVPTKLLARRLAYVTAPEGKAARLDWVRQPSAEGKFVVPSISLPNSTFLAERVREALASAAGGSRMRELLEALDYWRETSTAARLAERPGTAQPNPPYVVER